MRVGTLRAEVVGGESPARDLGCGWGLSGRGRRVAHIEGLKSASCCASSVRVVAGHVIQGVVCAWEAAVGGQASAVPGVGS